MEGPRMGTLRMVAACGAGLLITAAGFMIARAQDPAPETPALETPADVISADTSADQLPV